jgi:hypothetical protein
MNDYLNKFLAKDLSQFITLMTNVFNSIQDIVYIVEAGKTVRYESIIYHGRGTTEKASDYSRLVKRGSNSNVYARPEGEQNAGYSCEEAKEIWRVA